MSTLRFDSEDLALTEEFLSRAYTKMRIGGTAEHTRAQVSRYSVGSTSIDRLEFDYDMSHDARPIGKVCLGNVHAGSEGYRGVIQHARYNLIMFDPTLLDQVAAVLPGTGSQHVRLTGDRPVSPAAGRHLRQTIAYLRDHMLAEPAVRDVPLIASSASQLLAARVLNTFPNNALSRIPAIRLPQSPEHHPAGLPPPGPPPAAVPLPGPFLNPWMVKVPDPTAPRSPAAPQRARGRHPGLAGSGEATRAVGCRGPLCAARRSLRPSAR